MQSRLTPLSRSQLPTTPPPRLDPGDVFQCDVGHFPWDEWERWALAEGLDAEIAGQARLLIREAFNHGWNERLMSLCGWRDDGRELFRQAHRSPREVLYLWDILMRTDGLRGDYLQGSTDWTWGYFQPDARQILLLLYR